MKPVYIEREANFLLNTPTIEGLSFIRDLSKKNVIDFQHMNYKDVKNLFSSRKVGMIIDGSWSLNKFDEEGIDWGVEMIPLLKGQKRPRPLVYTKGIAVNKFSKNKNLAIEFLMYVTMSRELEKLWAKKYWVPANINLIEKVRSSDRDHAVLKVFDQCKHGDLFPTTQKIGIMLGPSNRALANIFLGQKDVEQALKLAEEEIVRMKAK